MTQADSLEHLGEVLEQLVSKAEPVLGKSGQKLVSEIRKTPLIGDKYEMLVNALIERVAGLKENLHDSSSVISDVKEKVSSMVPEAPVKQEKFLKWIPGKINQYIITIRSFQTRILVCQKKIEETMEKLRSERGKSRKSEELERQLKVELTLNSQLKDEQERLRSELEEMQRSGVRTGERVGVERAEMEAMRKKLVRFSKLIAALRRQVNNSASESEVRRLIEQSGIHSDDLVESDHESSEAPMNFGQSMGYSEAAMLAKIEKLKEKLDSVTKERDELAERLQMRNVQTSTTEHTEKIKLLSDQLKSESDELEKFKAQLSHSKSHRSTDLDSLHAKIKALHAKCKELQAQMYKLQERNQELLSERTKFETDLAKTKDSLLVARERLKAAGGDGLSLQNVGFQLAEALSEPFNPDLVDSEIPRLIEVARSQHVELSETARTKLNPFDAPSRRSSHSSSHHSSVHSRFDDLSNQITALQTQTH